MSKSKTEAKRGTFLHEKSRSDNSAFAQLLFLLLPELVFFITSFSVTENTRFQKTATDANARNVSSNFASEDTKIEKMKKKVLIIISVVILICLVFIILFFPFKNKTEVENEKFADEIITQFRNDAENDIKNDDVKTFGFGLPLPPKNKNQEIVQVKTDSILKNYGISIKNLGCTIMPELSKATEEYEKITEVYLTNRNGKGWRIKMENDIQKINKNYR